MLAPLAIIHDGAVIPPAVLEALVVQTIQRLHGLNAASAVALALFTIFAVALERLDREGPAPNYGVGPPCLSFAHGGFCF